MASARVVDAALDLLDRQLIASDGRLTGNVDDIEIELPPGWPDRRSDELPIVRALLSGPGVLAERFGGRLGRGWATLHRRLHPGPETPNAISLAVVTDIGSAVKLAVRREELGNHQFEAWFDQHVIGKIPGATHAAE